MVQISEAMWPVVAWEAERKAVAKGQVRAEDTYTIGIVGPIAGPIVAPAVSTRRVAFPHPARPKL